MLVLSRKQEESVVIRGSNHLEPMFKLTVLEIRGGEVKLGFEVHKNFLVHRWEVWEQILAADRFTDRN